MVKGIRGMKDKRKNSVYYVVSLVFYLMAMIQFFNDNSSLATTWIALGSAFLCLGASNQNKNK